MRPTSSCASPPATLPWGRTPLYTPLTHYIIIRSELIRYLFVNGPADVCNQTYEAQPLDSAESVNHCLSAPCRPRGVWHMPASSIDAPAVASTTDAPLESQLHPQEAAAPDGVDNAAHDQPLAACS